MHRLFCLPRLLHNESHESKHNTHALDGKASLTLCHFDTIWRGLARLPMQLSHFSSKHHCSMHKS